MYRDKKIGVVIPALNEEGSIHLVINDIPSIVDLIVVVDNGSTDKTAERATQAGAIVLQENQRGYGYACTTGINYLADNDIDIIVFLDGDYSDHPEELPNLVSPIVDQGYDFIVGSRIIGQREAGALLPQALFGNILAGFLIKLFWGYTFTDLGPFRALTLQAIERMKLVEFTYGWTVEMQIKAVKLGLKVREIPVSYRKRIGESKVTGTLSGTIKASYGILSTIFRHIWMK